MPGSLRGADELRANLRKLDSLTGIEILNGLEAWANEVVTAMKADHLFVGQGPGPGGHPDPRFYTHTAKLVNSMRADEATVFGDAAQVMVLAGGPDADYASKIEFGGPNSRAYPFMQPALASEQQKGVNIMNLAVKRAIDKV